MSNQYVGIETARKSLGDLVDDAQQGTDTILTRNGRAVARISAYEPSDTIRGLDLSQLAAATIWRARNNAASTAAEFDYDIAVNFEASVNGVGGPLSPLGSAAHEIARERDLDPETLWVDLQDELHAYARRCRDRKYSGWSSAARSRGQRIAYAD